MDQTDSPVVEFAVPVRSSRRLAAEFPGCDPVASDCVINLIRTHTLLADELSRRLRPFGVSLTGFQILGLLHVSGCPLRPSTIARWLRMTRGTVTGLLDSLERRGLVRRLDHPEDRRALRIELTDGACDQLQALLPVMFATENDVVADLTPAERAELVRLLGKIQARLLETVEGDRPGSCGVPD